MTNTTRHFSLDCPFATLVWDPILRGYLSSTSRDLKVISTLTDTPPLTLTHSAKGACIFGSLDMADKELRSSVGSDNPTPFRVLVHETVRLLYLRNIQATSGKQHLYPSLSPYTVRCEVASQALSQRPLETKGAAVNLSIIILTLVLTHWPLGDAVL